MNKIINTVIMERKKILRVTTVACTITAREYKGLGMTTMYGIIVKDEKN